MSNLKNNSSKNIINLTSTKSKDVKKNEIKKSILKSKIDYSKLSKKDLDNVQLDVLNLTQFKSLRKNKDNVSKKKLVSVKRDMYNSTIFESIDIKNNVIQLDRKKVRKQIRNKRNKFVNNILFYFDNNQLNDLKSSITSFNIFYKDVYTLNDYSLKSIASNNSDKETLKDLKQFLFIMKNRKQIIK